jgi:hypothetical protein
LTYFDQTARAIRERVPAELLPDERGTDDLFRLYALLVRVKGEAVTAEDVHDAWSLWMLGQHADHESIKPYSELDRTTREADHPFLEAIRAVAAGEG